MKTTTARAVLVVLVLLCLPAPAGAATSSVVLHVDSAAPLGAIPRRAAGIVMEFSVSDSTPVSLARDIGLRYGRYGTYPHSYGLGNMPKGCWSGSPSDYGVLDQELARARDFGMDMTQLEVQLIYISPCDALPGPLANALEQTGLSQLQYASISAAAIVTNPRSVQGMLRAQMDHMATRFGIRTFAVWNEPDTAFPMAPQIYDKLYALVDAAKRSIEGAHHGLRLRLGGPEASFADPTLVPQFLDFVGAQHLDLDSVTFHHYSPGGGQVNQTTPSFMRDIAQVRTWMATARQRYAWLGPELVIDEWGYDPSSLDAVDRDGAAFVASTLTTLVDERVAGAMYFNWQDKKPDECDQVWCRTPVLHLGVLDANDRPRATYEAFRLFHQLADARVHADPTTAALAGGQEWGALATRASDGDVFVLLHNWDPSGHGSDLHVRVIVDHMAVRSWTEETVTTAASVARVTGFGVPAVRLPANDIVLLTLRGYAHRSG